MRPLAPQEIYRAIEAFAPQARPYNFDDHYDCWGFVRYVYRHLLSGYLIDEELAADATSDANWEALASPDDLLPGDVLTTHSHHEPGQFHVGLYYGQVGAHHLMYDSSPAGNVPLFTDDPAAPGGLRLVGARQILTRYQRATEGTARLRNEGGAYVRLLSDQLRYRNVRIHRALREGNPNGSRDVVQLRRSMGLTALPFYCRRELPTDGQGREVYDNRFTKAESLYRPDGAPVPDDEYERVFGERESRRAEVREAGPGEAGLGWAVRVGRPTLTAQPSPACRTRRPTLRWCYAADRGSLAVSSAEPSAAARGRGADGMTYAERGGPGGDVTGCRIEVYRESHTLVEPDPWKHPVVSIEADRPLTAFALPPEVLVADTKYVVGVFARCGEHYSGEALATFVYQPAADNELVAYNTVRPFDLTPDNHALVTGSTPLLRWSLFTPRRNQASFTIALYEDGCLGSGAPCVHERTVASSACHYVVPAAARLRAGHTYYWYVRPRNREGYETFAPVEGVFVVGEADSAPRGSRGRRLASANRRAEGAREAGSQ